MVGIPDVSRAEVQLERKLKPEKWRIGGKDPQRANTSVLTPYRQLLYGTGQSFGLTTSTRHTKASHQTIQRWSLRTRLYGLSFDRGQLLTLSRNCEGFVLVVTFQQSHQSPIPISSSSFCDRNHDVQDGSGSPNSCGEPYLISPSV